MAVGEKGLERERERERESKKRSQKKRNEGQKQWLQSLIEAKAATLALQLAFAIEHCFSADMASPGLAS